MSDKFWSKEQLNSIKKPRGSNATHFRITAPGGRTALVTMKDRDTLSGVCGKIEIGRMVKAKKKGMVFKPFAVCPKPEPKEEPKTETKPTAKEAKPEAKPERKPEARTRPKPVRKCAFIDSLFNKGGLKIAKIHELTMKKFPSADPEKTLATVRCRPSHMRKAGLKPSWVKENGALA
jgi:hypothetical protein